MEGIAQQVSTLLGITKENSYLLIGVVLGYGLARILKRPKVHELGQPTAPSPHPIFSTTGAPSSFPSNTANSLVSSSITVNSSTLNLDPEKMEEVKRFLREGHKIEAIKVLREATGLGLAESKSIVDALEKVI